MQGCVSLCVDECTDEWMDGTKEGRKGPLAALPSLHPIYLYAHSRRFQLKHRRGRQRNSFSSGKLGWEERGGLAETSMARDSLKGQK